MSIRCSTRAALATTACVFVIAAAAACYPSGAIAAEVAADGTAEAEAIAFLTGRVEASIRRNEVGEVVSVSVGCMHGLWDDPRPYDKTKWLPQFAEQLKAFKKLKEVTVSDWVYSDDDMRHLATIPQLAGFANDTAFGNAEPFNGSGLKHLIMPAELQTLALMGNGITDDSLRHAGRLTSLRKLRVFSKNVTDDGLRHLAPLNLRELSLHTDRISGDGLEHLAPMRKMQILTLQNNKTTDAGLRHLAGMEELTELDLQDNNLTGEGLSHLGKLKSLRNLLLAENDIAGETTEHLSKLSHLELLTLHGNERVGDAALPPLVEMPALKEVTFAGKVTIDALRRFRQRRPDVKLSFDPMAAYGLGDHWHVRLDDDWRIRSVSFNQATDDDLAKFAAQRALADVESISLPFPQKITGKGLAHLQSHKQITSLHLDECDIGDEGLQAIGHLKQLKRLEIDKGGITGEGLAHLAELTELRELAITKNDLTDGDLNFLRGMTMLESLNLSCNRVTAQGAAKYLHDAKHLSRLNLSSDVFNGDHVVTGEALGRLLEAARAAR